MSRNIDKIFGEKNVPEGIFRKKMKTLKKILAPVLGLTIGMGGAYLAQSFERYLPTISPVKYETNDDFRWQYEILIKSGIIPQIK